MCTSAYIKTDEKQQNKCVILSVCCFKNKISTSVGVYNTHTHVKKKEWIFINKFYEIIKLKEMREIFVSFCKIK